MNSGSDDSEKVESLLGRFSGTKSNADKFVEAYRQYCWTVDSFDDLRLAPFHILATEGVVHADKDHKWHMTEIAKFCDSETENGSLLMATDYKEVDLDSPQSVAAGIIYGPDYDTQRNLTRLRNRHLGRKRSLALREFALGIESLERFVNRQPLRKVHECVFGVLAMESEPVDPRL